MSFQLHNFIRDFYNKNLFERIIIYVFLSAFIVKVVFEFGLGQWGFTQSQNRQWLFYGFLALDYLISWRKVVNIRVTVNPMSLFALIFFIMCAQGFFVGIMLGNAPFVILNDFVPPFMIGMNILRMQSTYEYKPIDFHFLLVACTILAAGTATFGLAGELLGKRTGPSTGGDTIWFPLILAGAFLYRQFPKWIAGISLILIVLILPDMNRSNMAFISVVLGGFILFKTIENPAKGIFALTVTIIAISIFWVSVPENSPAYQRIVGLSHIDLSERTGSIGERQAEWDAINAKQNRMGTTVQWLGLGFGGLYEMHSTHTYIRDYGHAHFAWAWYKLRFGNSGYIYLGILFFALIFNFYMGVRLGSYTNWFIALLCAISLIYCYTYVNGVFLLSGIQFFRIRKEKL